MISKKIAGYHIEPYHMNGLNWRLVPDEADSNHIKVITGFMPAWWTADYGIEFDEDFHLDSEVHRDTLEKMHLILSERFADLPGFSIGADYAHLYSLERRYGDAFLPALFGCSAFFDDASGHPYAEPSNLSDKELEAFDVPEIRSHPIMKLLLEETAAGKTTGELGFEGVINIAYKLRGLAMFTDMIDNPRRLNQLYAVVWKTIDTVVHIVRDWQDPLHEKPTFFVNCDCLINMISGEMYREQLLEFERRFAGSFDLFGIHTCNWTIDPYLDALGEVGGLAYLDMGPDSDLDKVHRLFPDLRPTVFFHPEKIRHLEIDEIRKEISGLCTRIGKGYILLSDLEAGTPDDHIRAVYEAAADF